MVAANATSLDRRGTTEVELDAPILRACYRAVDDHVVIDSAIMQRAARKTLGWVRTRQKFVDTDCIPTRWTPDDALFDTITMGFRPRDCNGVEPTRSRRLRLAASLESDAAEDVIGAVHPKHRQF